MWHTTFLSDGYRNSVLGYVEMLEKQINKDSKFSNISQDEKCKEIVFRLLPLLRSMKLSELFKALLEFIEMRKKDFPEFKA
jgi:hypothetical protein